MYMQYFLDRCSALSLWQIPMLCVLSPRLIMTEPCHLGTFERRSMDPQALLSASFTLVGRPTHAPWDESHACMGSMSHPRGTV